MGTKDKAVIEQDDEDLENLEDAPGAEDGEPTGDEDQDEEEGKGQASDSEDEGENEIVLEGDTQPQKGQVPIGVSKRFRQLTGKNKNLEAENSETTQQLANAQAERDVYKLALQQEQEKSGLAELKYPNPTDFDGGELDPKYPVAVQEYIDKSVAAGVNKATSKITETSTVQQTAQVESNELESQMQAHYGRASKLNVKDYEVTEDKAIETLGKENVRDLIGHLDSGTELILYHLGKNPEKAERYKEMFKTKKGSIKALVELGGLVSKLKVKPKSANSAPNPDDALPGGNSSKSNKQRGPKGATYS